MSSGVLCAWLSAALIITSVASVVLFVRARKLKAAVSKLEGELRDAARNSGFAMGELDRQWQRACEHVRELYEQAGRDDTPHWASPFYSPWE